MVNKRKKISSSRSKNTSQRIRNATIGTHAQGAVGSSKRRVGSNTVEFSNPKKASRAKRGEVDHVLPKTSSRESDSAYSKRVTQRRYAENTQRKARLKGIALALGIVILIVCVAGGVGVAAYFGSVSGKMGLGDSDAKSALVSPEEEKASYVLLVGEFSQTGQQYEGPDMLMLARIDEKTKQVAFISVPANLQVTLSDGETHRIADAQTIGGDSQLISSVASATGVKISHIVKTDAPGLVSLVDALGGLEVAVAQEVDDPNAGDIYIPAGTQVLDGQAVLTLCRAANFTDPIEARSANQRAVVSALADKLLATNAFSIVPTLDAIAGSVRTDYAADDVMSVIDIMRGIDPSRAYSLQLPGYETTNSSTGTDFYVLAGNEWDEMLTSLDAGEDPLADDAAVVEVDPTSFSITVRNGSGLITGGAAQMADLLGRGGFTVEETGNADRYVYKETLVVYNDDSFKDAAESVVRYLGVGRAVASNGYYTFATDVLVVLGDDWKPLN